MRNKKKNEYHYRRFSIGSILLIILVVLCTAGLVTFLIYAQNQREIEQQVLIDTSQTEEKMSHLEQERKNAGSALVINEIYNNDNNEAWLELYNPSSFDIDLSGYKIVCYCNEIMEFVLPESVEIKSTDYYTANLSEDTSLVNGMDGNIIFDGTETLLLENSDGQVINHISIPKLEKNEAYGRRTDGEDLFCFQNATMGSANSEENEIMVNSPVLGMPSGYYEKSFMLEMHVAEGRKIYYTLDGSKPDENSILYTEPILIDDASNQDNKFSLYSDLNIYGAVYTPKSTIDKAYIVRAVAIDESGKISQESSGTYFVNSLSKSAYTDLPVVSIIVEPDDLFDYFDGIYVTGQDYDAATIQGAVSFDSANYWRNVSVPATVQYFEPSRAMTYEKNVLLQTDKGTELNTAQKSLVIVGTDKEGNNKSSMYDYTTSEQSKTNLYLNNGENDSMTKIRNMVINRLTDQNDILHNELAPCVVFLNGEYWGVYNMVKKETETSIAETFETYADNIVIARENDNLGVPGAAEQYMLTDNSIDQIYYNKLETYINTNSFTSDEKYKELCEMIDIESLIDCFGVLIYTGNAKWSSDTYYMWRSKNITDDKECNGIWHFALSDASLSIGATSSSGVKMNTFLSLSVTRNILLKKLFENKKFRDSFKNKFEELMNETFSGERVNSVLNEINLIYRRPMMEYYTRFVKASASDIFSEYSNDILAFFASRPTYISRYLEEEVK